MTGRARNLGRATRGRGQAPQSQQSSVGGPRPGQPPAGGPTPSHPQPPVGAWGRPGPSQQQQQPPRQQQQQPPRQGGVQLGRSTTGAARPDAAAGGDGLAEKMSSLAVTGGNGNGNGNGNGRRGNGNGNGQAVGRGNYRHRDGILHTRPAECVNKMGTSGNNIKLIANYFKMETSSSWTLYQYRVDFKIEEDRPGVLRSLMKDVAPKINLAGYIFDGTVLFTSQRLSNTNEVIHTEAVRRSDNTVIPVDIKLVTDVQFGDNQNIQVFNILIRRCLGYLNLQLVGRNFFDAKASIRIPEHNVELWPGYITSIRQHERDILMCSEVATKVMRTETALQVLLKCRHAYQQNYQDAFKKAMIGEVVLTDYNNRTYKVDDVNFNLTASSKFPMRDGTEVSYMDYYQNKYQKRIQDPKQPLLASRSKMRKIRAGEDEIIYLIPELCRCTGITDDMRSNFKFTSALAQYTRVDPRDRIRKLDDFKKRLNSEKQVVKELNDWTMKIGNLVEINARQLPMELIIVGPEKKYAPDDRFDWTNNLRGDTMMYNAKVDQWVLIAPERIMRDVTQFANCLIKCANTMKFLLPQPVTMAVPDDRPQTLIDATDRAVSKQKPNFLMYIVSNNRADRYSAIKKRCTVDRGIISQVVLQKQLNNKGVMSIATKIAIQLNAKLGGCPWTTEIPLSGLMAVGYDACHDTSSKNKSYGAMVATLNKSMSRYFSAVSHHSSGEELSNSLAFDLKKALVKYSAINNALPSRIVFYRDGVGEGQIHYVFSHEVERVKEVLNEVYGGPTWKLGYIIVTKRINTRLVANGRNPPPGTVVDDVITKPEFYDFFLISQIVRQGTVAPTNYNVIFDNLGLTPDNIHRLTYKMTYLYYNWSGTVRVPAPVQYAHKLAFLVSQSLHNSPHVNLEDCLFFL